MARTKRTPAHSPHASSGMGMAYDAARSQVVLFGGYGRNLSLHGSTWTWDGSDWTSRTPTHAPMKRGLPGMAYEAASGQVVLFGGTATAITWVTLGPGMAPIGRIARCPCRRAAPGTDRPADRGVRR
jgi:hypothetical protein